ncbi:ComEC/Rec2 family competence protein [Corynebacterium dentalis]|uniref:ComEC/Rec2 family competence protein n=1 Tax=Corynebacterium dentalis TaxID=2014528 RepID=UPI00370D1D63
MSPSDSARALIATHRQRADRDAHSPEAIRERRGHDFRLVPAALVMWLAVAATIITRGPWPTAVCSTLVVVLVAFRWRGAFGPTSAFTDHLLTWWRTAVVALASGVIGAGSAWVRVLILDATPALTQVFAGRSPRIVGEFTVAGTPKQLAEGSVLIPVDVPQLGTIPLFLNAERAHGSAHQDSAEAASVSGAEAGQIDALNLQPGHRISMSATMQLDDRPGLVPVTLRGERGVEWAHNPGPDGVWAWTAWLRGGLRWAVSPLPRDEAGLIPGMVVGDTSGQSPEAGDWFVSTGLSHLTAVSGANVAVVIGTVLVMLTALSVPRRWTALGCAVALGAFVLVVGPEPSVLRATVMGSVGVVAVATVRWSDVVASLCFAVIVLLLLSPGLAVSFGFALSVVATVGIVLLAPRMSTSFLRWWTHRCHDWWAREPTVAEALLVRLVCVSIAADAVTAPVIVLMTGTVSVTAIAANLLVAWCVPPITVVGLGLAPIGGVLSSFHVPQQLAWLLSGGLLPPAWWIVTVAESLAQVPRVETPGGAVWGVIWAAVLALVISSAFFLHRWRQLRWAWLAVATALALTLNFEEPPPEERDMAAVPSTVSLAGKRVHEVSDDEYALRLEGLDPRVDVIVNRSCGRPHNRPSVTHDGVPVFYPCRDGTELTDYTGGME